jgi:hypothetical protein
LSKRGHYEEDGTWIEERAIGVALWPQIQKHNWFCSQCGIYMKLYPISHDLEVTHWSCGTCKKVVTTTERDEAFEACIQLAKNEYDLKTLEYSKEQRYWTIISNLFIGDSRIGARRKPITPTERQEIMDKTQAALEDTLHISFENFQEFFNTE